MKTKVIILILAVALLVGTTVTAFAAPETYGLNSRGKIVFDNDTPETEDDVIFDANDLYKLAAKCQ